MWQIKDIFCCRFTLLIYLVQRLILNISGVLARLMTMTMRCVCLGGAVTTTNRAENRTLRMVIGGASLSQSMSITLTFMVSISSTVFFLVIRLFLLM